MNLPRSYNNIHKKLRYIKRMFKIVYSKSMEFDHIEDIMVLELKHTKSKKYWGLWIYPKKGYKLPRRYLI